MVTCKVFIATSIDGYISDRDGKLDWLHSIPNPDQDDMGYSDFMNSVESIIMGRKTFETVLGFDMEWPYSVPVFILSNSLRNLPPNAPSNVYIVNGSLNTILAEINSKGYSSVYVDGGKTIQSFLAEDLIDEITITTIPYVLGGGTRLFSPMDMSLLYTCIQSKHFLNSINQATYVRKREE